MARLKMEGGRRVRPNPGNIDMNKTKFLDKWPNGRPFKHGAMEIHFIFAPASRMSAEADVECLMEDMLEYERGEDYHIPAWNYSYPGQTDYWKGHITITFDNDETFVMTKLMWDNSLDTSTD